MDIGKASDVGHAVHWGAPMVTTACLKTVVYCKTVAACAISKGTPKFVVIFVAKDGFFQVGFQVIFEVFRQ